MKSHFSYRCGPVVQEAVLAFKESWESGLEVFPVQTSGSTGAPKTILLKRSQLEASAKRTLDFFKLQPGDSALLALPVHTIAGRMMIVRALIGGLRLIISDPRIDPMSCLEPEENLAFFPLSPMQLQQLETGHLSRIQSILLGGSPLSPQLETQIASQHSNCFIGFGMTETVSHIALRKVGTPCYQALEGVDFAENEGKLVINDSFLSITNLLTNDLVELVNNKAFKWIGRADFAINSGGVKIHPEQLEQLLGDHVNGPFFIAGIPDDTFGQKCIMVADTMTEIEHFEQLRAICKEHFGPYSEPKELHRLPFIYSSGTKVNRRLTLEQLNIRE